MPLALSEILDTVRMTEADAFDIRTVTLGISLRGCASRDAESTRRNIYDRVTRTAEQHVAAAQDVERQYGVRIANKRISITPAALAAEGLDAEGFVRLAETLDQAATEVGVDYIAGFTALVEKGATPGDAALIEALPEALATTARVCGSVAVGSTQAGINADAVLQVAHAIKGMAARTADRDSIGCAKFVAFCNAVGDNPFVAGAFHGPSEPGAALNVGISGPGVVLRAVEAVGDRGDFGAVTDAIKTAAFKITRAGELIGRRVAERLRERSGQAIPFGVVDISLAPTPAERDSVGDVLKAFGLEHVGAPGTTAALAMLNEAVKRGGLMAARHVGGLSGAFMPVSEDQAMIEAAAAGHLSLEKLEAMSAICSVGLDMVAIPGDTSAETIAGILFDEFAIGMINDKTTAVRLLPVAGKGVGEWADYGGLLGRAPIQPVSQVSNVVFAHRGGRIPAPIRSLTN
ncbi:PFL family protein [Rubrivirga sp. IMCC43871]|uniref:PFL family protein n=1 Tax=Rubrivirga sp. IMCC43871 TaxID=3391575 RepID=UPI0039902194